jgi:hypothetical protein
MQGGRDPNGASYKSAPVAESPAGTRKMFAGWRWR